MSDAFDETAVARGLRAGDREAWGMLYREYSVRVWRYASRMIGQDAAAIADVVQESFLAAAESALTYDSERGTLWSWLAGITHHKAARHWQHHSRRNESTLPYDGEIPSHDGLDLSPDILLQSRELAEQVRHTLAAMPAEYASLLVSKHIDEHSTAQIQILFGGSSDSVRSKLVRARREFRELFQRLTGTEWDSVGNETTSRKKTTPNT